MFFDYDKISALKPTYTPFPTLEQREVWDALPEDVKQAYITGGEAMLQHPYPVLPASLYYRYKKDGDRNEFENLYFERRGKLIKLVMAELVENKGRFLSEIIDGIFLICEETTWVLPAHNHMSWHGGTHGYYDVQEQVIDLFAGETGGLLACTWQSFRSAFDGIDPLINKRIRYELNRRIIEPYIMRRDMLWMKNTFNWTTWCTSNCLLVSLIMIDDPLLRQSAVRKAMESIDYFLTRYPDDGGCDEGPSYWGRAGASLFDTLEMLYEASDGAISLFQNEKVQNIIKYITALHIHDNCFVNFADGSRIETPPVTPIYGYATLTGDENMKGFAKMIYDATPNPYEILLTNATNLYRLVRLSVKTEEIRGITAVYQPAKSVYYNNIQVLAAREKNLFLACKGGSNAESHNHNDVGNFIIYKENQPILIDIGVETYSKKTFSAERYTIWTMRSCYHNLPTINGKEQYSAPQARAQDVLYMENAGCSQLAMELKAAYQEDDTLTSLARTVTLHREETPYVEVSDAISLTEPTTEYYYTMISHAEPLATAPGKLKIQNAVLEFDPTLSWEAEKVVLEDQRLRANWQDALYVIRFTGNAAIKDKTFVWKVS